MKIGRYRLPLEENVMIMGILNVTPDSFSDGGKYNKKDQMLFHAQEMIEQGADILDIGGESTRPGHVPVSLQEEQDRVLPAIEEIKSRFDIPVSLDTYHGETAKAGIQAGADLINDIWGLKFDDKIASVIAGADVACCLMHNRMDGGTGYEADMVAHVLRDLKESLDIAEKAGIKKERIILDPGIGFAKTTEQNLMMLHHLDAMESLGYPVLLGTSRKSVIGNTLQLPVDQRLEGTLATTALGVMKGCRIIRVHDVAANKRVVQMMEAILRA